MPFLAPFAAAFLISVSASAESIEAFGHRWSVPSAYEWLVEGSGPGQAMRMLVARPSVQPRRPSQYALAETAAFGEVTVEAEVKRDGGSLILVYAWRDENHFNYAHLSVDAAAKQPVHNGIFHVHGGDRVRISNQDGPAALPTTEWTPVKLSYSGQDGRGLGGSGRKQTAQPARDRSEFRRGPGRAGIVL